MISIARGAFFIAALAASGPLKADKVDDFIKTEMTKHHVTGVSLAIIQDGKIVKAQGYGFTDQKTKTPVTTSTLFQAGSISKSIAAVGALKLVEQGKLSLDENVNDRLASWKVPDNQFTKDKKVTLRGILSHTAGLTVHGFPGYAVTDKIPSLVQVLDGKKPSNTPAIRVDVLPGSIWRYSGGGYTVMQQLMVDVTHKTFPELLQESVLAPFGMRDSSFAQPLPENLAARTASGYFADESAVPGRWHLYPEMAAAGLWTTASDLATFAIGIQKSLAGAANPVLSKSMTEQMLTVQKDGDGLGVFISGRGAAKRFAHDGRDAGFDANLVAYQTTGQGAAIMINANEDTGMASRILEVIAQEYKWPGYPIRPKLSVIPDKEPDVTKSLRIMALGLADGKLDDSQFTSEFGTRIKMVLKQGGGQQLKSLGELASMSLLQRTSPDGGRSYIYRMEYKKMTMRMRCVFNQNGKITELDFSPE